MNMNDIINSAEQNAAESIKAEQGDYIIDGLLYCGKCNTPKQVRINIFGRERTPFCLCRCETERRNRAEEERKRADFERRVKELRRAGFPESDMHDWTFANDDRKNEKITNIMQAYVDNFSTMKKDGKGLLLYGDVGTGKTFAAACVANALIDKGYPVLMTNFARIGNTVQGLFEGKQEYYDSFNNFPLLIIDDLSAERKTEYMQEIVYTVIDGRYRAGLPVIVTTNLTSDELKNPSEVTNKRTFSRLFEMCVPVEVTGTDRRREKLRKDYKEYKDILGL